jgi:hypothetical protein
LYEEYGCGLCFTDEAEMKKEIFANLGVLARNPFSLHRNPCFATPVYFSRKGAKTLSKRQVRGASFQLSNLNHDQKYEGLQINQTSPLSNMFPLAFYSAN